MPYRDKETHRTYHREYQREWRKRNPEKIAAYQKKFYDKNREYFYEKARKWRESNPDRHAANWRSWSYDSRLKRKYGMSTDQFEKMLSSQKYCCAICKEPFTSPRHRHVDHCHEMNYVRGILCQRCNLAIGLMRNSSTIALEAAHYLSQPAAVTTAPPQ